MQNLQGYSMLNIVAVWWVQNLEGLSYAEYCSFMVNAKIAMTTPWTKIVAKS